ncbi:MAG: hypothetical protein HY864_10370 [Chloroflexi bacterium]|nr:hypothetical protein [Chloroflexota bacterium]
MKLTAHGWASSFSGLIVAAATILGITGVAFASGGEIFNPGSLSNQVGAPLGGVTSHSEIQQCSACHASPWETATMADRCIACHTDITAQLQDPTSLHSLVKFGQTDLNCRTCHTEHHGPTATLTRIPPGWDPHDQLGFSLKTHRLRMDGTPFECKDCHEKGYSGPFDQLVCATCHLKVDQVFTQDHILTFWTDCQACHDGLDTHGSTFDHNQVPFKLVGMHALTLCSKCHVNARNLPDLQATAQDCFACHEKDDQHLGQFGTKCGVCHTAEGWGKSAQFDHNLANFKLTGKHVTVVCAACHVNNKYKGTPSDCFSCHSKDDKHNGQFGTDCASCHTSDGWNRAVDHSQFAFKLEGKHSIVACESCHKDTDFKNTPTNCVACHAKDDTHAGQFGAQCESCHTPENWTSATFDHNSVSFKLTAHQTRSDGTAFACKDCHVKGYASPFDQTACANCHLNENQAFASEHILTFWTNCMACHDGIDSHGKAFDHNNVPFKLAGKHALAKCSSCHINDRTIADMQATSQECYTCHQKDDFHQGQFGTQCGSCHAPDAWKPAKVDHSKFAFHLDGKHSTVACASCHINGVFKGTPQDCASCHTKDDAHAGSLGNQCGTCHSPAGWTPATFDHNSVSFKLTAHQTKSDGTAFACKDCHVNGYAAPFDQNACGNCHLQIDQAFSTEHFLTFGTDCKACHDGVESHGKAFDHNKVPFTLMGKHAAVKCSACHVNARTLTDLKSAPQACESCHLKDDHHNGQFGTDCAACHSPEGWSLAKVDHSKFAFQLDGQHASVSCDSCHKNGVFKGTPQDCFSCHAQDDNHKGQLGTQCAACHSPSGWKPAKVDHSQFAFHLDGKHSAVACESCHINGVFKGTPKDCASCHTKDDAHAGSLGAQCGTCHSPAGWSPAVFDHNTVSFKLTAHKTKSDGSAFACKDCHANGYSKPFDQNTCGNCHLQVNQAFSTEHFLTFGTNCMACHDGIDSRGSNFDHDKVAFNLDGKHILAKCSACHANARTLADLKATPQECVACHLKDDNHNGQLGTQCGACHMPTGWKPATVNHSLFAFHLDGKHASVACESCHVNGVFKGTPMDCASCHTKDDAHNGTLGTLCGACHSPNGWKPATVDHSKFAFHLDGQHASVSCESCHKNGVFKGTPQDCVSCHIENDVHGGTLGTQCAACHSPNGWKPATVDHSKFAFHLDGKHATVACASCHQNNVFKGTPQDCASCHTKDDAHNGTLGNQCGTCHSPAGWSPVTFDHNKVSFKLTAHKTKSDGSAFACKDCHVNGYSKPFDQNTCGNCHLQINQAFSTEHFLTFGTNCMACHDGVESLGSGFNHNMVPFKLTGKHGPLACSKCHVNAHTLNDLKATPQACVSCHLKDDHHNGQFGTECAACHSSEGWSLAKVDHSLFAFKLDGKHAAVACQSCHINGQFKGTPQDCASCHIKNDAHNGQLGTNCATCHTPNGWKPSTFNHANSAFPLTGKHTSVNCTACHINGQFKGTPMDCASCHAKNDPHGGKLGSQCSECHTTNGWMPTTFDHKNSNFQLTGKHTTVTCAQCHKDKFFVGTPTACSSCHGSTDPHSGALGAQCETCHTTAAWKPTTFNHANSAFKLTGKHTTVLCAACHKDMKFKGTPTTCFACHAANDRHGGKYGTNCETCHTTTAWKPATFNHNLSAFPLTGAHINTACSACHINGVFIGTPKDCNSCHKGKDPHAGKAGTNCATCHTTTAWKPATFKHTFPLTHGKNPIATCVTCHPSTTSAYTCFSCHEHTATNMAEKHKEVKNYSTTTCANCHADGKD